MDVIPTTPWKDMPQLADYEDLLTWGGFANYVDNDYAYQILFCNGVFYTGHLGSNQMTKCPATSKLDYVTME